MDVHLPVMAWLAEHVAYMYNKSHVYEDGKTAYEKLREESTKAKCCLLDVRYFIASLVSPSKELWPQGGCQEHGWGRLGLLTSTWLLQKRGRLSEQDLCEECLKRRRGVQIFCAEFLVNPGPTGTITYDEGTESFPGT